MPCHSLCVCVSHRVTSNPTGRWWFQPPMELLCVAVCEGVCVYVPSHLEPTKHAESNDEKEVRRTQQWRHQALTWYIQQSWQDPRLHSSRRHSFFHTHILILGITHQLQFRKDEDIKAFIAATNASMGALKEIWSNPYLDTYNKYLLFPEQYQWTSSVGAAIPSLTN